MTDDNTPAPKPRATINWRWVPLWMGVAVLVGLGLHWLLQLTMNIISELELVAGSTSRKVLLIFILLLYALLIATPFMPGIEVGVALLMLQGSTIAPLVYLSTILGLMLAYLIGHHVPIKWLHRVLCDVGLSRLCVYLEKIEATSIEDRLAAQRDYLPKWLAKLTVDYRYISIGVLLNVPGTFAIGGGGGILMAAGFSRLFTTWRILLTLAIFTLPVPLFVWLTGVSLF